MRKSLRERATIGVFLCVSFSLGGEDVLPSHFFCCFMHQLTSLLPIAVIADSSSKLTVKALVISWKNIRTIVHSYLCMKGKLSVTLRGRTALKYRLGYNNECVSILYSSLLVFSSIIVHTSNQLLYTSSVLYLSAFW